MSWKPQGNPVDKTLNRHGLPTPRNSVDDHPPRRQRSPRGSSRKSTNRRRSTNTTLPDRSNTTSPQSMSSPLQHYGAIYDCHGIVEEPREQKISPIARVQSSPVQRPHPIGGNAHFSHQGDYRHHGNATRNAPYAAQAASSAPYQLPPPMGHNYGLITIIGKGSMAVTGDIIEAHTSSHLRRRHTYQGVTMDTTAAGVYTAAQNGDRSTSNLVAGDIHVGQGGAAGFVASMGRF